MSQYSIPFSLTNVSAVAISDINADSTLTTGSTLNQSIWSGVGTFARGKPFTPLKITKANYLDVLGDAIHPSVGSQFEPMRHVYEAVQQTDGYVFRVVPEDAKFPLVIFSYEKDSSGKYTISYSTSALAYGADIELTEGQFLAVYVDDGDPSTTRHITFVADPSDATRFNLKLTQTNKLGVTTTLEIVSVSFDTEGVDAMGRPNYIETALESRSGYLRALCDAAVAPLVGFTATTALAFTGGTNGTQNTISDGQYTTAIEALSNANVNYTAVLGLGCYNSVAIGLLADICKDRRVDGYFDLKPTLTYAEAVTAAGDIGLVGTDYNSLCLYHFPYTHKDKWTTGRVAVGLSGTAYAAKAKGVALNNDVGGWHYSPAGETRGLINRANIQLISGSGTPDDDAMYTARINKVAVSTTGKMIIDDALTTYSEENYLRFQHVASLMDTISRYFFQLGRTLKHQPDKITETSLTREMTKILDRFVASGALVTPRDTDSDGTSPYLLKVTQVEFDYWKVEWSCCPTGSARRLLGVPSLIK
ncbi:hypothetical protein [Pantoea sp. CCBC3-3-1]|uniref:hypothetical protein n=1 Tax=Pantoea sp. CCBC3-3-1 TaxID=2490851 RepID=UPI0011BEBC25|nr:hypothetical protein [Pantoea sp. CCBC3-3-1]